MAVTELTGTDVSGEPAIPQAGVAAGSVEAGKAGEQPGAGAPGVRAAETETPLRRNRRFQALWIGGAGSMLAANITTVATPVLILAMTGSAAKAGLYGSFDAAASLAAGIPAGTVLDRGNRRTVLIGADLLRAILFGSVIVALTLGHLSLLHLLAVAAVTGALRPFAGGARMLATRAVVPPSQLTSALTREEVRTHSASILGPSVAGLLYAASRTLPFVGVALGYLLSACCAFAVPRERGRSAERRSEAGGALDGIKLLLRNPMLRTSLIAIALLNLGGSAVELAVVVLIRSHGGSSSQVGFAFALTSVGGLAGAALVGPLHRLLRPGWLLIALCAVIGLLNMLLAIPLGSWWYGGVMATSMLGVPAAVVLLDLLIFRQVDDAVRGRTMSATMTILSAGNSLGPLAAGLALQFLGAITAVLAFSGVFLIAALYAGTNYAVRCAQWPATSPAAS
ncbi:MAG TPA: MFS transporter [Actinocrinis sp.]|nr:MFS transporter [Actinocrinis sp.]